MKWNEAYDKKLLFACLFATFAYLWYLFGYEFCWLLHQPTGIFNSQELKKIFTTKFTNRWKTVNINYQQLLTFVLFRQKNAFINVYYYWMFNTSAKISTAVIVQLSYKECWIFFYRFHHDLFCELVFSVDWGLFMLLVYTFCWRVFRCVQVKHQKLYSVFMPCRMMQRTVLFRERSRKSALSSLTNLPTTRSSKVVYSFSRHISMVIMRLFLRPHYALQSVLLSVCPRPVPLDSRRKLIFDVVINWGNNF